MTREDVWPPKSARQALLSSPGGRQKYADYQSGLAPSPIKRSATTPSLVDRLRLARSDQDRLIIRDEAEEEDEETLQLQIAAIEAKLKLKKLQSRPRQEERLQSSSKAQVTTGSFVYRQANPSQLEVPVSPSRRNIITVEPKSPSRVILGIDKGFTGADVSLRRARSTVQSPLKNSCRDVFKGSRPQSGTPTANLLRPKKDVLAPTTKSFSERMVETRDSERAQADKRGSADKQRAKSFRIDHAEVENLRGVAEDSIRLRARSPLRNERNPQPTNHHPNSSNTVESHKKSPTLSALKAKAAEDNGDPSLYEGFSGLHLSTRILPHSFLKRTLPTDQYTIYRVPDLLKNVTSPAYEIPDEVDDFVVFGVIASKSSPLDQKSKTDDKMKSSDEWTKKWEDGSQNRKKFMALTITDLKWTVDLYLFDTAVPRYHRLSPGTVIAILNPSIMPPKRGREDTGAFSLAIHNGDDTVLEIGTSQHLGHCNAKKKDGQVCGSWVNASKSEICEWHLNAQIARTQSSRMGVNTGANGFGGRGSNDKHNIFDPRLRGEGSGGNYTRSGGLQSKEGRGFDGATGSHYYITSSLKSRPGVGGSHGYHADVSTARMLDREDPFIAEGQSSRDKEARLQKRLATQEKEREIARQLADIGNGSSAGADYMMRKANGDNSLRPRDGRRHNQTDMADRRAGGTTPTAVTGVDFRSQVGRKRPAQDVRLSPVKKTRFMMRTGIKEAGKESVGPGVQIRDKDLDDTDDDDLDIV